MCDSVARPHTVGRGPTNSCSSVSDLSEAISDMSLSTSPGSDLPTSVSSGNMIDMMSALPNCEIGEVGKKSDPYPRKKRVMRQLSSNPYLASSEMSPDDQSPHPVILGANSYAGEPSPEVLDVFYSREDLSSSSHRLPHIRANSVPYVSDFVINSDDSDDQDAGGGKPERNINKTIHHNNSNRIPDSGHNYFGNNTSDNHSTFSHQSFHEESPSLQNGRDNIDFSSFQHGSSPHCEVESRQRFTYHQTYNHNQQAASSLHPHADTGSNRYFSHSPAPSKRLENVIPIPASESCPPSQSHFSFSNVHLRREKERHQSASSYHNQPQSREINSWGHFSKHTERHYRYRRSHCNSSDSDDDSQRHHKNRSFGIPSPCSPCSPSEKSHTHSHSHTSPSQYNNNNNNSHNRHRSSSTSVNTSARPSCNKNKNEVCVIEKSSDYNDVKPQVFKDRFQVMKRWFAECNDGQKNIVLKGLLKLCELPQLHLLSVHMSRELHHGCPSNCEDILTWLPPSLASKVLTYLDPVSLCRAAQVCGVWRTLVEDQSLWRRFCCQTKWRLSKAAEHKQVISHMSAEGSIQWKHVFAERFRLRNNWLKGRRTVRTFEGHHQGISCVQFDDSRIVSGSSDKTIKVWNMRTNAPWSVQTLMGHHGTVRCLHLEGNRLVSGSCDTTIKVWDLSTEESWSSIACKVTMTGHADTVRCLQADDDKVISGSYDKTLKIWDLKSGELRQTLRGHHGSVLCVHFSETKIVSGSVDNTIKLWNYEGSCMNTLCGHQDAVTCLMFDSTRIVSGSLDHNLKFWDVHSGECLNTIDWKMAEGHTGVVRCLQADSWRVVSAGDDKTIKVWNLATGERLVTLRDHTDGVTCLQFNDFIIVSGSYDKTVKLWDFSCC